MNKSKNKKNGDIEQKRSDHEVPGVSPGAGWESVVGKIIL